MLARMVAAVAVAALMGGCAGYGTYTPGPDREINLQTLNHPSLEAVMAESFRWTITNLPPSVSPQAARIGEFASEPDGGPVLISLAPGMTPVQYRAVVGKAWAGAEPLTRARLAERSYRLGRIRIRGSSAWVDIHRPIEAMPGRHQCVTVQLRGGTSPWRVTGFEAWEVGVISLPAPAPIDGNEPKAEPTEEG